MARIINGKVIVTSADKKEAVESAGGKYNKTVVGNYVQGDAKKSKSPKDKVAKPTTDAEDVTIINGNYVENLEGSFVRGDVYE